MHEFNIKKKKFKQHCKGKTCPEFQAVTGFLCDNLSVVAAVYRDGQNKQILFSVCMCACAGP
jgi:hypothetical protein